ncbi:MAG: chemotaxis protein CheW [Spirochaetes bacterium]|nr:chemotaxis protein CheW [Spirochaetota bacterium]MBU0954833.1 chemotaxis protein CheW [Spirochaetota bacterium]
MKSSEIKEALSASEGLEEIGLADTEELKSRFFVFSVGDLLFALPPEAVHEIIAGLEVYPLPSCPPYIPGLVNCHGQPYTAFDLRVLFENERQPAAMFLVLKLEQDNVAIGCTEVNEIVDLPASSVSTFAAADADGRFCLAMFDHGGQRVLVLSIPQLLAQLEQDLG